MMIPTAFIKDLIRERQGLKMQVNHEVRDSWGHPQLITGPVMVLPYQKAKTDSKGDTYYVSETYILMPENLDIRTQTENQTRQRSIYEIQLYEATNTIQGHFTFPDEIKTLIQEKIMDPTDFYISLGVSDVTAISGTPSFSLYDQEVPISTGTKVFEKVTKGLSVKELPFKDLDKDIPFAIKLRVKGSEQLAFHPVGKRTQVEINANWPSPGFVGNFTTQEHTITNEGFNARWEVNEFNRNFPGFWKGNSYNFTDQWFGVNLVNPVDDYQKNMRSVKYALLIIGLSFLLFFFFELITGAKMHPIQYVLVGFALVIFYCLLLSLSEQLGFDLAYLISSVATLILILFYCSYILVNKRQVGILGAVMLGLYIYIYIILQMEDYALLVGSIGLFAILSGIMYITRRINYYELKTTE